MLITLGKLALENNALTRPKTLSLLAYLALEGRKPRSHARELLWGQASDAAASLRIALQQLRTAGVLLEEQKTLACAISCDASLLLEKLDAGDEAGAVALYSGVFLDGLQFDSSEFEEWVLVTRELITVRVTKAYLHLALIALEQADLPAASQHAIAAHGLSQTVPLESEDLLVLFGILEDCRHDLVVVVRQELLDLNIQIPDRSKVIVRNLPSAISGFVFRSEQAALETLVQNQRLITIVGYGGAGKSRLALEVLRGLPETHSTFFIPLESILEPTDVLSACLRAMSYRESTSEPLEQLKTQIGLKNIVLLLDNAEHLVSIGETLEHLLESCPNLKILLTSRERLGVLGETVFPLEGFADDESALELLDLACRRTGTNFVWHTKTAIKICNLLERFPLAIELAAALITVLPLEAILEALQQHLDALEAQGGRERHRSMRAVFNWSWSLLSNPQRLGLMRLATFRDGFSRVAALQVMNSNFTVIAALVAKSLVQNQQNGRYRLHPLIAQYSLEVLESIPKEAKSAKAAHAEVFLSWLEQNAPLVRTVQAGMVLGAFETDLENIKVAWGWLCEHPDLARFDRLQDVVSLFDARARFEEGVQLFEAAIQVLEPRMVLTEKTGAEDSELIQALGVLGINAAWLLHRYNSYEKATLYAEMVYDFSERLNDNFRLKILNVLGVISRTLLKLDLAIKYFTEMEDIANSNQNITRRAMAKHNIAEIYVFQGNYKKAIRFYNDALKIYKSTKNNMNLIYLELAVIQFYIFFEKNRISLEKMLLRNELAALKYKENHVLQMNKIYQIFFYTKNKNIKEAKRQAAYFVENFAFVSENTQVFYKIALSELKIYEMDYVSAEKEILFSIKKSIEKNLPLPLQFSLYILANLFILKNEIEKVITVLQFLYGQKILNHWVEEKASDLIKKNNLMFDKISDNTKAMALFE